MMSTTVVVLPPPGLVVVQVPVIALIVVVDCDKLPGETTLEMSVPMVKRLPALGTSYLLLLSFALEYALYCKAVVKGKLGGLYDQVVEPVAKFQGTADVLTKLVALHHWPVLIF